MIKREALEAIYQEGDLLLGEAEGKMYLYRGRDAYWLSDYPFEPCLYVKAFDGAMTVIHHAFTVEDLRRAARTDGAITMITGDEYDVRGICRLLLKAIDLPLAKVDIHYVEEHCFADYLKAHGAISSETAVDLASAGMKNPNVMNTFLHSKKVGRRADGAFYLLGPKEDDDRFSRVISNLVRFGCGYRTLSGKRQYYAWHGYPNRNDDFITYAEIDEREFERIQAEYPCEIDADRETAEQFRTKYVNGHPLIKEGWNVSL